MRATPTKRFSFGKNKMRIIIKGERNTMKKYSEGIFYIITIVMILSGFLIHPLGGLLAMKVIHKASGLLFCIFLVAHATRYGKKLRRKKSHVS